MSPQYGKPWPTNDWDRLAGFGHPSKFEWISHLGFVTGMTSLTGGQPNFAWSSAISWAGTLYIHFSGAFAPWQNFSMCKLHFASKSCVLLYWQHYGKHSTCGCQANFVAWYKEWNYGTSQTALPIFGWVQWAAITLGIGPHFSFFCFPHLISAVADWMSAILPHMVWP